MQGNGRGGRFLHQTPGGNSILSGGKFQKTILINIGGPSKIQAPEKGGDGAQSKSRTLGKFILE